MSTVFGSVDLQEMFHPDTCFCRGASRRQFGCLLASFPAWYGRNSFPSSRCNIRVFSWKQRALTRHETCPVPWSWIVQPSEPWKKKVCSVWIAQPQVLYYGSTQWTKTLESWRQSCECTGKRDCFLVELLKLFMKISLHRHLVTFLWRNVSNLGWSVWDEVKEAC